MSRCQRHLLVPLAPFGERITIQNKCYEVRSLYKWIITDNKNILPGIQTAITFEEKQRLIQAHEELSKIPTILTRNELIKIYPNLQLIHTINLSTKNYTNIDVNAFINLSNLCTLILYDNKIIGLQPDTFNNLPELNLLTLSHNQIIKLQTNTFNNLPSLKNYI
jgi:hypothetical protein